MIGSKVIYGGVISLLMLFGGMTTAYATQPVGTETVEETNIETETEEETNIENVTEASATVTGGLFSSKVTVNSGNFNVSLDCGLDGVVDYYSGTRVRLTVTSGSDFTGNVSVASTYSSDYPSSYASMRYSKSVSMAAGEENVLDYYLSNVGDGGIEIQITDGGGDVVYLENDVINLMYGSGGDITIGVLSDDIAALSYLSAAKVDVSGTEVAYSIIDLTDSTLPESEVGYGVLDCMYIDNYDTANITAKQYDAIKSWCIQGGSLILALGNDAESVLHVFDDDFFAYELGGEGKEDVTFSNANLITDSEDSQKAYKYTGVPVTGINIEGAEVATGVSEGAEAYVRSMGQGQILVLPYSLGLAPIADSEGENTVASNVLLGGLTASMKKEAVGVYSAYSVSNDSTGLRVAKYKNDKTNASPTAIIIALVLYIIVSGPVTYIVLKKKKRREYIWIALPAWALIGTLTMFVVSFKYKVTKPVNMTFATADISGDTAVMNLYSDVVTAEAGSYTLKLGEECGQLSTSSAASYSSYSLGAADYSNDTVPMELIEKADGSELSFYSSSPFSDVALSTTYVKSNDIGSIQNNLKLYTDGFEGDIKNNTEYDMTNVVVLSENGYYCVDKLPAGGAVSIQRQSIYSYKKSSYYDETIFADYYNQRYGKDLDSYNVPDDISAQDQYMLSLFNTLSAPDSSEGNIVIWANIDREASILRTGDTEDYSGYLVYDISSAEYEDVDGAYYWSVFDCATPDSTFDSEELMMYSTSSDVKVVFNNSDSIKELVYAGQRPDSNVATYAYNYETDSYDAIFEDNQTVLSGDELNKYLRNNTILFRFESEDDYYYNYLPYISARGGSR